MKAIDFSCKHNVMLMNEDGTMLPMDVPFFEPLLIAPETWRIFSAGDYSYLVAGDDEAIVIDSGYGCGNIRDFCQTLTEKPVRRILNTHHHFDHTANNCYFECALMSEESREFATIPFKSFEGIEFPRDYPVEIIGEGTVIRLGGRDLETFFIPDHAVGSLAFLDRKRRILFSGDEILYTGIYISGSVARRERQFTKLAERRNEFDTICGGSAIFEADVLDKYLENLRYILAGHEGVPVEPCKPAPTLPPDAEGRVIYRRKDPRPCDMKVAASTGMAFIRSMDHAGVKVTYDMRRIWD